MPLRWSIYYYRWVIDDGEPELEVDERVEWFAVKVGSMDRMAHAQAGVQSAMEVEDYSYNVVAKVVHVSTSAAVIDFGLRAVAGSDLLPTACQAGDYVAGRIKLYFRYALIRCPTKFSKRWPMNGLWKLWWPT